LPKGECVNLYIPLYAIAAIGLAVLLWLLPALYRRCQLSLAKHPSLTGHARLARRFASLVRFYEYDANWLSVDGAPESIVRARREGFAQLGRRLASATRAGRQLTGAVQPALSDMQFTASYRVPFQFRKAVSEHLPLATFVERSHGGELIDLDGNRLYDLTGSYGVNVFGYDFYKSCIDAGADRVRDLGPVLGHYHPVTADNVERLRQISGLDEISFHMSGTEAVMQAVRLARYHTSRTHLVRFSGAYHGWWGDVQPGVGNPAVARETYTLRDMHPASLRVLRTRSDIACVLVNPLQALHPNASAPGDSTLVDSSRTASFDRKSYTSWLRELRAVCSERGIVLIFDEVFLGFRLALGGAQEYFGVRADMVTYGKTLGGGLPVGVLCGRKDLMKRFRDDRPADICFARGTFNTHPYVMGAMNEFLRRLATIDIARHYAGLDERWNTRAAQLNEKLKTTGVPVGVANLSSVWTICYTTPSRYNWMFQYYLRAHGLALSWVGTGRLIFPINCSDVDFANIIELIVQAASAMQHDGWWWHGGTQTNNTIRRQLTREMIRELLPGGSRRGLGAKPSPPVDANPEVPH
jgi:glutamate-1-semialdehyde 2,1-aminomutase